MSKIQRVPRSLLALFGIVGENPPQTLDDSVRAIADITQTILAELPVEEQISNNAAAVAGSIVEVIVPSGEVWFVHGAQISIPNAAGATNNTLYLIWEGTILDMQTSFLQPALTRRDQAWSRYNPAQPLVAVAGDVFTGRLDVTDAAGVQTLSLLVAFRRILV